MSKTGMTSDQITTFYDLTIPTSFGSKIASKNTEISAKY